MAKKRGKSVSFDAMVKFFMSTYHIPTKRDVDQINARLDRIEKLILASTASRGRRSAAARNSVRQSGATASDAVLDVIRKNQDGIRFSEIQDKTGFDEKKLRNIIFRLHKLKRIKRINRGVYTIV